MFHGAMAPSRIDFCLSGTTRSMSMSTMLPKPSHSGQAPSGLLKLNSRGSGGRIFDATIVAHQPRVPLHPAPRSTIDLGERTAQIGRGRRLFFDVQHRLTMPLVEGRFQAVAQALVRGTAGREPIDNRRAKWRHRRAFRSARSVRLLIVRR